MYSFRLIKLAAIAAFGLAASSAAQERFDFEVRDDMFRAFGGNQAAFKSAMARIEARLETAPDDAVALVWRGVGRSLQAQDAFRGGDFAGAKTSWTSGMADMD